MEDQINQIEVNNLCPSKTSVSPEVPPIPLEKKPKLSQTILLVLLIIAFLGAIGFVSYQNYQLRNSISESQDQNTPKVTPTPNPTTNWKTYTNEKYGFSFNYPQSWQMSGEINSGEGPQISFSNVSEGHSININVRKVTGFNYCYKYNERQTVVVGGKNAETADGVGPSEMCDKPEEYTNRGNTFVLIPLEDETGGLPINQIHISYDYLLSELNLAKINLNQILSTFKFETPLAGKEVSLPEDLISVVENDAVKNSPIGKVSTGDIIIGQSQLEGNFASVAVNYINDGGYVVFLAKVDGVWQIVTGGQEPPPCSVLAPFNFPNSFSCN